jgi:hypothetical protein
MRDGSLGGGLTRGRDFRDVGRVGAEAGPLDTGDRRLISGAKGSWIRRSCDGTEKKP